MKKKILFLTLFLTISYTNASSLYRVVVPRVDELSANAKRSGELALDQADNKLKVFVGGSFKQIPDTFKEILPAVSKNSINIITIGSGQVLIQGNKYINTSVITCNLSNQGPGGYDEDLPTNHQINYLYLIPNPNNVSQFDCLVSHRSDGPGVYNGPSKRILSFYTNSTLTAEAGASNLSSVSLTLVPENITTCKSLPLFNFPSPVIQYTLAVSCVFNGSMKIYRDTACTEAHKIIDCTTYLSQAAVHRGYTPSLYVKGNVLAGTNLYIYQMVEEVK